MVRLLTLSGLILLLAVPTASAGPREKILRECQEGRITGNYTPRQLRDARKNIPTDIDEYSDCRDVLARAVQTAGSDNLSYAANQGERDDLAKALSDAPEGADVRGDRIVPGASGLAVDAARHGLPTTLLTVLILLGLCAAAAAAPAVRRRVIARRKP
jgi:hypothetical protein